MDIAFFYNVPLIEMEKLAKERWNVQMEYWEEFGEFLSKNTVCIELIIKVSRNANLSPIIKHSAILMIYHVLKKE